MDNMQFFVVIIMMVGFCVFLKLENDENQKRYKKVKKEGKK